MASKSGHGKMLTLRAMLGRWIVKDRRWTEQAQIRVQRRDLVLAVMNLQVLLLESYLF